MHMRATQHFHRGLLLGTTRIKRKEIQRNTLRYFLEFLVFFNKRIKEKSKNERNNDNEPIYYNYSVASYIYIDLPIAGQFKIPVYTKGERTYNFSCKRCNASGECTYRPKGECGAK